HADPDAGGGGREAEEGGGGREAQEGQARARQVVVRERRWFFAWDGERAGVSASERLILGLPPSSSVRGFFVEAKENLNQNLGLRMKDRDSDFKSTVAEQRNLAKAAPSEAAKARQNDNKRAFFNEKILLRHSSLASSGEKKIGGEKWTVPRNRLTPELLQEAVNRGVGDDLSPLVVQHLFDAKTNTVISTSDARTQCRSGVCYDVISSPAGTVEDGGILTSDAQHRRVTRDDGYRHQPVARRWCDCKFGTREDPRGPAGPVAERSAATGTREMSNTFPASLRQKTGRAISGAELTKARETRFEDIVNEIEEKKKRLVETTRALGEEKAKHYRHCQVR
ncbi:hypothetical protein THAOC_07980, partial [Thalassiosira oceanica]